MMGRAKPRILCVSRSSSQMEAIRSALSSRDYEVVEASTPEQAVAVCVSNSLAAIVLDSEFATEAGWSAAQTFKMVKPHLPVVLLGHNHEASPPHGVDAVASNYSAILRKLNALLNGDRS
jgi:DNA-binding NtrC family response regulator